MATIRRTSSIPRQAEELPALTQVVPVTEFGNFISPLVRELKALPQERQSESLETFKLIYGFLKGKNLGSLEFTREDVLFLLTDKAGAVLRRPILHLHLADKLEDALRADSDTEKRIKELAIRPLRTTGWSHFVANAEKPRVRREILKEYPGEEVWTDQRKWHYEFKSTAAENPVFSYGLSQMAVGIAIEFDGKHERMVNKIFRRHYFEHKGPEFYCDPSHAFNFTWDLKCIFISVSRLAGLNEKLPRLQKEASFMLVEDNPIHTMWADALDHAKGLQRYAPPKSRESGDDLSRKSESRGYYSSAERALEVIYGEGRVLRPPGIILSDIELLGEMNGIQFVREVYRREKAAGRNPMIMMVYSSNPGPYLEDIEKLKKESIVIGSWNKKDFTPKKMIDAVNEELQRREK